MKINKIIRKSVFKKLSSSVFVGVMALGALPINSYADEVIESEKSQPASISRISGSDRYMTSVEISKYLSGAQEVILASGDSFADALSASSLSVGKNPIILLPEKSNKKEVVEALKNLGVSKISVVGGSINSSPILGDIKASFSNDEIKIYAGANRFETNIKVLMAKNNISSLDEVSDTSSNSDKVQGVDENKDTQNTAVEDKVDESKKSEDTNVTNSIEVVDNESIEKKNYSLLVASGDVYADALAASPLLNRYNSDLILSDKNRLDPMTEKYLAKTKATSISAVGGKNTIGEDVVNSIKNNAKVGSVSRYEGSDRYLTSLKIAEKVGNYENIIIASGESFPDALSASALAQKLNAPIVLTQKNVIPQDLKNLLLNNRNNIKNIYIIGGENTISKKVETDVSTLLSGKMVEEPKSLPKKNVLNTPYISQLYPTYAPVGCEPTSLLMGLKAKGYAKDVSLKKFLDDMPKTSSNPEKGFVGSPYKPSEVLRTTINPKPLSQYGQRYGKVKSMEGASMSEIKEELLKGNPVVVYVTLHWRTPYYRTFNIEGKKVRMLRNNHALLLDGYDATTDRFHISDPYNHETSGANRKKPFKYWKSAKTVENLYNIRKFAVSVE